MGNKMGWIIGGLVGVFLLGAILFALFWPRPTPPTRMTLGPDRLTVLSPKKPLTLLMPAAPSGAGDAGDDYKKALDLLAANRDAVTNVLVKSEEARQGKPLSPAELAVIQPIVDAVADGAAKARMTYYGRIVPADIDIPTDPPFADRMQDLAGVVLLASLHEFAGGESHYDAAERRLFDILVMGQHMIDERARLPIVRRGVGLQSLACMWLKPLYGQWKKPDRVDLVTDYEYGLETISGTYRDYYQKVCWVARPKAGDVWNLAVNHQDPAVRTEAVLSMGIVKLVAANKWDKRRVEQSFQQLSQSNNPIVREAVRWARELDWARVDRLMTEF